MSVVHYKFKNNLDYKTISFDGLSISLGDFKQAIMSQNKTKSGEFDLEVKNAQSKEAYTDNSTQIPKNASVIIRRIPVGPKGKALTAAERPQSPGDAAKPNEDEVTDETPVIPLSKLNKVADLASANASEENKIAAMMSQAGEDWDPALYAKPKGRSFNAAPRMPPPPHYMCFRCRKPGHWIQNCPKNNDPNYDLKVRRTTGIPKSFLRLADKPTQKGALLIPDTGQYAVPIVDHHAYEQAAIKKRSKDAQATTVESEKPIPSEYFCPICKKIMNNAVVVPCCGDSFCDTCIVKCLLENEHVCPSCQTEDVSPASIVINKHLRQAIIKVKSSGFDGGSLSATSSPSAHRDGDVTTQGRSTPVPMTTAAVAGVEATVVTTAPTLNTGVASPAVEPSKSEDGQVASTATSTSSTPQTALVVSQDGKAAGTALQAAVPPPALPQTAIIDPRLQRPEGMVQPIAMPVPAPVTLAPVHRPAYVVSASTVGHTFHPHHPLVHPTVPGLAATYGHLPHPAALVPTRHTLPFAGLETDVGMMNEEEFYRAKLKLQERGRRKRRKDDDDRKTRKKERSRSRRRERRESPSIRRSPSEAAFRSVRKDRARRRGRSRSWTPTGSSSRSSWSHSWSRSKSPSRSYSRSKSRTPVNWDRSRSPSREKKAKSSRVEDERGKRKKQEKDLKETKKKSKTNDYEKRNVKSDKSNEPKKEVKKKSKMDVDVDGNASDKVNIKTSKAKESKKDLKKNDVDGGVSENRNVKNSKSNEAKKEVKKGVKKPRVENNMGTSEKRDVKNVKSEEAKRETKRNVKKSKEESDVDKGTAEKVNSKKSNEPKKNAEKKTTPDINIDTSSTAKVSTKSVKSKDKEKDVTMKYRLDMEENMSKKMSVKTVKSNELKERKDVRRKAKADGDVKEIEMETSKENTVKKRSKVDNIVSSISEKSDVKKSDTTRKEIVKKCSISDLRDLVNTGSSPKTDLSKLEKSSKKDLSKKNAKAAYKESDRASDTTKKCADGTKTSHVSSKLAKEIVLSAKDLGDRKERSRKKGDDLFDEREFSSRTKKEDFPVASTLLEKKSKSGRSSNVDSKSAGKLSTVKDDREELPEKQKTTRIVVEKTKDKHARDVSKTSEKYVRTVFVKEERSSKDNKLISSEKETNKDEDRKKDIKKADNLKKTSSSGDIIHREVSLKAKHSSSRLDYSVGKIKRNDEVSKLRVEERAKESLKKKSEQSRKHSVSDESDNWLSQEDAEKKPKRREEKKKKRKSVSDDSDDEKRVPRKRTKDEDFLESEDEISEKASKKKKKKKSSVHEEERKDAKHKKRKHKKKHKKHKHKKKSKHRERKRSEEVYSEESDDEDDSDRKETHNDEITREQEDMSVDEESTKSIESVFEGESTKAVQSESENDPEPESGSEDEIIRSGESLQEEVNSDNDDIVDEVQEDTAEKDRGDGIEEDDVEELDYNEESEQENGQDNEGEEEIELDEGEHKGHDEEKSAEEVEDDEEQEEIEDDSEVEEVEEGVEEGKETEEEDLEEEIENEGLEQDEEQQEQDDDDDDDGKMSEEEESLEVEECEEIQEGDHVEVEEMGEIELEHDSENDQGSGEQGVEVEDEVTNEEALLAGDEDHESLPGNEFNDEVLLVAHVVEQPIEAFLEDTVVEGSMEKKNNDEAFLEDDTATLASNSQSNEESLETSDVVNDVGDDVVEGVSEIAVNQETEENVGESNLNEMSENFQTDLFEDSTDMSSQELCGDIGSKDMKTVEDSDLQNSVCDNKVIIGDFHSRPLTQSSDVSRDKHDNDDTMYHYDTRQGRKSFENYPSYDSGVGTLDSMYDDDPNYTDFGGPAANRRTSTDLFRAMINDDTEELY